MLKEIVEWYRHRWLKPDSDLLHAYQRCFNSPDGQRVIQHLLDTVYCSVYEGSDPTECVIHNARRSVVHEMLQLINEVPQQAPPSVPLLEEQPESPLGETYGRPLVG